MGKKMLFEDICWFGVVCNFLPFFLHGSDFIYNFATRQEY